MLKIADLKKARIWSIKYVRRSVYVIQYNYTSIQYKILTQVFTNNLTQETNLLTPSIHLPVLLCRFHLVTSVFFFDIKQNLISPVFFWYDPADCILRRPRSIQIGLGHLPLEWYKRVDCHLRRFKKRRFIHETKGSAKKREKLDGMELECFPLVKRARIKSVFVVYITF